MGNKGRLVTVGCSFTSYKWPTWADFLGRHFNEFKNYGIPGTDNSTITRIVTNLTEPSDTVVVMWTSYTRKILRHNYEDTYGYSTNHDGGSFIDDKVFLTSYYNQYERLLNSLDCLHYAHTDAQYRGYRLYNFAAFDFVRGEMNSAISDDMKKIMTERQFYIDQIVSPNVTDFIPRKQKSEDRHPTPQEHYNFYKEIICPAMGLTPLEYHE